MPIYGIIGILRAILDHNLGVAATVWGINTKLKVGCVLGRKIGVAVTVWGINTKLDGCVLGGKNGVAVTVSQKFLGLGPP